ncbi:MAG TPA: PEGA domain-containing protein [Chitinispirillaceae bacterium]|nr:PEGA domain-containing protein [Chitinispirillaceae bacterium]
MNTESNKDFWFEDALRADLTSAAIDFNAVEACLLERIDKTEELGVLSLLKAEEIVPMERFQRVEKQLFTQVAQYKEYEEPVNECIAAQDDLTHAQWERLEAKLFARINDCADLPVWERVVMTPQTEPLPGHWESIENIIFDEIAKSDKQEPWIICARNEEVSTPAIIEQEELLFERIFNEKDSLKSFEQELKREVVLSLSQLEEIEDSLFARIERHKAQIKLEKQPFWAFIEHYFTVFKAAGLVSALLLISIWGFSVNRRHNNRSESAVPTFAYQLKGAAVNIADLNGKIDKSCLSVSGGTVKLVNRHGSIELQNDSKIEMLKVTQKAAHYRVSLSDIEKDSLSASRITFLVNKHQPDEKFLINTSDYQITVKGTYFKLEPGYRGTVTTRVLEGVIKVSSDLFDEVEIRAGQILEYDSQTERYTVKNGGQSVKRQDLEQVPEINTLMKQRLVQIKSAVTGADVFIDGKLYGNAPVAVRCHPGIYKVTLARDGYLKLDTMVNISVDENNFVFTLNKIEKPVLVQKTEPVKRVINSKEKPRVINSVPKVDSQEITPELIRSTFLEPDSSVKQNEQIYLKAQNEEMAGNWKEAITFYQQVFDNKSSSRLSREDALFSIGRLKAENIHNPAEASQVFLTYLALFPQGSFAGESWLRLAELEFRSRPENATRYYEKFFQVYPRHPRIIELKNRVGVIYLQQKRFDEAIELFKEALNGPVFPGEKEKAVISENLKRAMQQKLISSRSLVNR